MKEAVKLNLANFAWARFSFDVNSGSYVILKNIVT